MRPVIGLVKWLKSQYSKRNLAGRLDEYRKLGMHIGQNVLFYPDTWIDKAYCFLISIGDNSGFGPRCMVIAHDASMNEFLGGARVGKVVIHEDSFLGGGTIILPGVEIGPRTIVCAGSVVSRSLPPDTVCAGSPARVISSLDEYLKKHQYQADTRPRFAWEEFKDVQAISPKRKADLLEAVMDGDAYIVGQRYSPARLRHNTVMGLRKGLGDPLEHPGDP